MKKQLLSIMAMATIITACQQGNTQQSGIDLANLDTTVAVGTDFYNYATGGWQRLHPLTDEYSRYGSFDVLTENSRAQLRDIIDSVAALKDVKDGSIEQKIADLYNSAMDSVELNANGLDELRLMISATEEYQSTPEVIDQWLEKRWKLLQRQGVDGMFGFYIGADEKDSRNNLMFIMQDGLTMGQRDYYLDTDEATVGIREAYQKFILGMTRHAGFTESQAQQIKTDVMRIETRLAKASKSMTELRDVEANYNKMSYADLKKNFSGIDWDDYFAIFSIKPGTIKEVCVGQIDFMHEVEKILAEESKAALQNYYLWHAIDMAAGYIDDESQAMNFAFYGTAMSGTQQDRPRWKHAVSAVEHGLGEALGQLYVARFFPPQAKTRMEKLVANLQVALGERINVQDWMSDETKKVAQEKLNAFYVKVGYPNKWKDYSTLKIGKHYLENMLACNEWAIQDMIASHLNKPVDKDEWHMTPQTVNAYYNPTTNEICFPAGILQPPFFDMNADDAFNYGAIGVVIGHEMTHGFDDQGAKYDKDGNMRDWWTKEDTERFEERIDVMRQYHNNIEVLPGLYANGSLTLGENIADHGGLMVSYQAFQNATAKAPLADIDGFTPNQRFFLAYANVWGQNIREAEIRKRVKGDPHQLGMWRVNGQVPHLDAWYETFGITEKDPMYLPKEKRVTIW